MLRQQFYPIIALLFVMPFLVSCGGSSGDSGDGSGGQDDVIVDDGNIIITPPDDGDSDNQQGGDTNIDSLLTDDSVISRLLTQATFGPSSADIQAMKGKNLSGWLKNEFEQPPSYTSPLIMQYRQLGLNDSAAMAFWKNAIGAEDQLRQRMSFALSQIFVISDFNGNLLYDYPLAVGYYQDILTRYAFGNYRDLLEAVTYSPAMGFYLTYMGSEKGDQQTGRMPDENYAREVLQLFTIGLVKLNIDGTETTDQQGNPIETYDNKDITGLAKVFTGLNLNEDGLDDEDEEDNDNPAFAMPMQTFSDSHSSLEKTFLGQTIPANTSAQESISQALDIIFNHANVAPFISKQLIQRFVTSNPSPDYIKRVATAFETGSFTLADGSSVGDAKRGNLKATIAAVLSDQQARSENKTINFGKVTEPVLRFTHWARAFNMTNITPEYMISLWDTSSADTLGQHPYRSPSVFNFYRPGYTAPGTLTGQAGLTMPEMQIINATTIPGYINFISFFINREMDSDEYIEEFAEFVSTDELTLNPENAAKSFYSDYQPEMLLAHDASLLVEHLNLLLTYNRLGEISKQRIIDAINEVPVADKSHRVEIAILMMMTSPEFIVQN